ncbi:MAG: HTH domain-containing protein, partial [Faecalibacillus sp.]
MTGDKRRDTIINLLKNSDKPVSGTYLAKTLQVSRQVIVQDIALLRAKNIDIQSTHRGYVIHEKNECVRIFKVKHEDDEVEKELNLIVDLGGYIEDVFVYHKVYNIVKADLKI